MATRDELLGALVTRYSARIRKERGRILDEFVTVEFVCIASTRCVCCVREELIVLWEASDRVCGKRLRERVPILVEAMERHGHLQLTAEVRIGLQTMSAATIDRALCQAREPGSRSRRRHASPSAAIRRSVAVRTFDGWDDPPPGFVEADLVAHSGPYSKGQLCADLDADGHRDGLD